MTKIDNNLSEAFGLEKPIENPIEVMPKREITPVDKNLDKVDSDYNDTRGNLHNLLEKGEEALLHALEVAKQSEHPRAFEVVGNMIKQLADVNQQLMELHKQRQSFDDKKDKGSDAKSVTNNAIFVGSTSELNKMIGKLKGE